MNMKTVLTDTSRVKIDELMSETETNMKYFDDMFLKVLDSYTRSLDDIMAEIHDNIIEQEYPSTDVLEKYLLKLSNCIYFISERAEKLGIYDAITKAAFKETYNNLYLDSQSSNVGIPGAKKPTVAESTAVAENGSIYESVMNDMYNKVYKTVKSKLDSANTMLSSISKVISRRMSEAQLSAFTMPAVLNTNDTEGALPAEPELTYNNIR